MIDYPVFKSGLYLLLIYDNYYLEGSTTLFSSLDFSAAKHSKWLVSDSSGPVNTLVWSLCFKKTYILNTIYANQMQDERMIEN